MPSSAKTFAYDAGSDTGTATGGSMQDPITLADIDGSVELGGHVAVSGEDNQTYTVDCHLVIGASDTDTFFRIQPGETLIMDEDKQLILYLQALRNSYEFNNTFWANYGNDLPEQIMGIQKSGIRRVYYKLQLTLGASGALVPLLGSGNTASAVYTAPSSGAAGSSSFKLANVPPPAVEGSVGPVLVIELVNAGVVPL